MKHTRFVTSASAFHLTSFKTVFLCFFFFSIQKLFRREDGELSVLGSLGAGACAGMTLDRAGSTLLKVIGREMFLKFNQ